MKRKDLSGVQRYTDIKHRFLEGMNGMRQSGEANISLINRVRFRLP